MMSGENGCAVGQIKICEQKMDAILGKLEEHGRDLETQKVLEESHAREMFGKIDDLKDLISGGGHIGTGISPRVGAMEIRVATLERCGEKQEIREQERVQHEKRMLWGVLTAIGSGVLALAFEGISWLIGRVANHG